MLSIANGLFVLVIKEISLPIRCLIACAFFGGGPYLWYYALFPAIYYVIYIPVYYVIYIPVYYVIWIPVYYIGYYVGYIPTYYVILTPLYWIGYYVFYCGPYYILYGLYYVLYYIVIAAVMLFDFLASIAILRAFVVKAVTTAYTVISAPFLEFVLKPL